MSLYMLSMTVSAIAIILASNALFLVRRWRAEDDALYQELDLHRSRTDERVAEFDQHVQEALDVVQVKEALSKLDGSDRAALMLITGFTEQEIADLGGLD